MNKSRILYPLGILLLIGLSALIAPTGRAASAGGEKWAIQVGINEYDNSAIMMELF